jgi:hypothetical protein
VAQARRQWTFVVCDSLEKVFADEAPRPMNEDISCSVFLGECASWQVAFLPPTVEDILEHEKLGELDFSVEGSAPVRMSAVELVPCAVAAFDNPDSGYLRTMPGMYPDLLVPLSTGRVAPIVGQWRAVWFDVSVDDESAAGVHTFTVRATSTMTNDVVFERTVTVEVLPRRLPELGIVNTHWFHCDGLANYYGVEVFSEEHWAAIERFIEKATQASINSLLTPTWTPPLDTAVGGTRTPTQLIDIDYADGAYSFDFEKLIRWLSICRRYGVRYIEVAHFFTQWGARFAPAIYVRRDGALNRDFGWDTPATDPSYRRLLEQLIPELKAVLAEHWDEERVIYHISDEPSGDMLESYTLAKNVVADLLGEVVMVDALSGYEYYASGAVPLPVVATDHVAPFLANGVEDYWVYYCVGQNKDVANRFISLPSLRNRVLGWQLFAFGAKGFLQWGYNFYNSQESRRSINPFADTSVGGVFPAGDSFLVYPGPQGVPYESIRFRVFAAAMDDHRAMTLAAGLGGRDAVMRMVDPDGDLAFDRFSYDPDFYRRGREAINRFIVDLDAR